jgi:hypothetical protein
MYHEDEGRRNKVKASARKKAVENGLKYWAYLLEHPCIDCGESDPVTLECDHVRGEKRAAVSYLVTHGSPWSEVLDEIAKCEVRCSNCHRKRTAKALGWYRYLLGA